MYLQKLFGLAFLLCTLVSPSFGHAADTYKFGKGHSEIFFSWDHAGVSVQSGEFLDFSGILTFNPDKLSLSTIDVTIQADSVHTGVPRLDYELKGKSFFSTREHPEITFKSTSVRRTGKNTADVTGDLTIRGITNPVTLAVDLVHNGAHPIGKLFPSSYSGNWLGFHATTSVNRSDFDMRKYTPITSNRIQISINVEMKPKRE